MSGLRSRVNNDIGISEFIPANVSLNIYYIVFLALLFNVVFLFHYIHILKIEYTQTFILRFLQYFLAFFIMLYILFYNGYSVESVAGVGLFIIMLPYLYFLFKAFMEFLNTLTLRTVRGRIRWLIFILCLSILFIFLQNIIVIDPK